MEKNNAKYFLGIALLSIWGLVGYRVYNKMNSNNNWRIPNQEISFSNPQSSIDSFGLYLDYESPFKVAKASFTPQVVVANNASSTSGINTNKVAQRKVKKRKSQPQKVAFPSVSYKGSISLKNGRTAALIKINNQITNLGVGEEFENVMLQKIYNDSIQVRFENRDSIFFKAR